MSPKENLRQEHGNIMRLFLVWQKMLANLAHPEAGSIKALERIMDLLEIYVDNCHHGKEELILFPALGELENADIKQLIGELRSDHRSGRLLLGEIKSEFGRLRDKVKSDPSLFIDKSKSYIGLFRKHIRNENAHLFPMIETVFSKEEQTWMLAQFERFESENMARKKYTAFEADFEKLQI